jgi:hypothetical protein
MYADPEVAAPPEPEPLPNLQGLAAAGTLVGTPRDEAEAEADDPPAKDPGPDPGDDLATTMASPAPIWAEEFTEPEEWDAAEPHRVADPAPPADQPARPLFADHERRVPPGAPLPPPPPTGGPGAPVSTAAAAGGNGPDTGTGTGSRYWPFDDPDETSGFSGKEGRSWLQLAGIVALCVALVVAVFIAFDLGKGKHQPSGTAATTAPATPTVTGSAIRIVSAHDFDPEGDPPEENPGETALAIDGKPDTGWHTMTYKGDAALGGLKSGVGLVLDLGSEQKVGSVQVRLAGSPTGLELFATPPGDDNPPVELADARRVTGTTADGTTVVLRADPTVRTRFLVVWLTRLPAVSGGFRGEITEVTVRS